jgi:hypothetical protein
MARVVRYEASLLERAVGGTAVGLVVGMLTFVHSRLPTWPAAFPIPDQTAVILLLLVGFALAVLELDMRSYISITLIAAAVSLPTYTALDFAPLLTSGVSPGQLFFVLVFAGGGQFSAWMLFFPVLFAGSGTYVLYRNGPFS